MRKEWLLLLASATFTLLIAIGLLRWLAPELLGISRNLQLVQVDEKVPPFYEGVFRVEDTRSNDFLLKDPFTNVRAHPFYPAIGSLGPHDILGFRNMRVPNIADIVIIGDSQTYGNNAVLGENFPSQLEQFLQDKQNTTYSMAVGGWGAIQYFDMFLNATLFQPRVVVIAFYTGNDSIESFQMAYSVDRWKSLIPDSSLSASDAPSAKFPAPESEWWTVEFQDGVKTVFTSKLRLTSNQEHPAVKAGYAIMAKSAELISKNAEPFPVQLVFTIVPTKELVYSKKIEQENLQQPVDYQTLVAQETRNIGKLLEQLKSFDNGIYVDIVGPLQDAAMGPNPLYPESADGHPTRLGYNVIARTLAKQISSFLPNKPSGLIVVKVGDDYFPTLVRNNGRWLFKDNSFLVENGWDIAELAVVEKRDVASLPLRGVIDTVNPGRFGP